MGIRLSTRSETFVPAENQTWLGSATGTQAAKSITLDGDACIAIFPDGVVPSGVALYKLANDRYAPVIVGEEANSDVLLFTTTLVVAGDKTAAAGFWHGRVISANAPAAVGTYVGLSAGVQAALTHIKFD